MPEDFTWQVEKTWGIYQFTSFSTWTPSIWLLSVFLLCGLIHSPQADHIAEGKAGPQHR